METYKETYDAPNLCLILHAYQPPYPVQQKSIVKRIVKHCYSPVLNMLLNHPEYKVTFNINASLVEMLVEFPHVLENLNILVKRKQIELLESAAYHPLLPLISEDEIKFQIGLNSKINKKLIFDGYEPKGFFPPELAITPQIIEVISELGYKYIIGASCLFEEVEKSPWRVKLPNGQSIMLLTRNKDLSNAIAFKQYPSIKNFIEH
ncbi:MAG: hypothetical protein ACFFBD_12360, partial [Candidatus Hodarchaeota archaeon]